MSLEKFNLKFKDRILLEKMKLDKDPNAKVRRRIKLEQLAKDAGIIGYSSLSFEELIVAIEVEAKHKSKIAGELRDLKDQLRIDEEKREKKSFMDELGGL